jgi:hypothetical protein
VSVATLVGATIRRPMAQTWQGYFIAGRCNEILNLVCANVIADDSESEVKNENGEFRGHKIESKHDDNDRRTAALIGSATQAIVSLRSSCLVGIYPHATSEFGADRFGARLERLLDSRPTRRHFGGPRIVANHAGATLPNRTVLGMHYRLYCDRSLVCTLS